MNAYHNNDPKSGIGRGFTHINNNNNSHFDAGWFNNSNNGYWYGVNSSTNGNCVNSTNVIHYVNGASSHNGGYFGVSRGYMTNCCTSSGCGITAATSVDIGMYFPTLVTPSTASPVITASQHSRVLDECRVRERGTLPLVGTDSAGSHRGIHYIIFRQFG